MAEQDILLELKVSNEEATAKILEAKSALEGLKKTRADLDKQMKAGNITYEEYVKEVAKVNEETQVFNNQLRANTNVIKQNVRESQSKVDSLNSMRAELKKAVTEYDNLSKAERASAKGQELLDHIKEMTDEVKTAEAETGRFQRNVGNYPKVFDLSSTSMGKFATMVEALSGGTGKMSDGLKGAAVQVKNLGAQFLKLLANPFVAIFTAIAGAVLAVVNAMKKNDDAMTALQSAFSAFKPILDVIKAGLEALVGVITKVVEGFSSFVRSITNAIPFLREYAKAEEDIVRATDALEETERNYTISHSKRQMQIAEATTKSKDAEKYSYKERLAFVDEAIRLQRIDLEERKKIAAEKLRLAKQEAKLNRDTSDETKNNIAQLTAALYDAEKEYQTGIRELVSQRKSFVDAEKKAADDARKAAREAAKKRAEDAKKARETELNEMRAYEDLMLSAMQEGEEKEAETIRISYARKVEDLKKRLETEKNLTEESRRLINEQIILLEAESQTKILALHDKYSKEELKKKEEAAKALLEKTKADHKKMEEELKLHYENLINQEVEGSIAQLEATARVRKEQLDKMHREEEESTEAFYARQLAAQKAYNDATKALNDAQVAGEIAKTEILGSVMSGLQGIMEAFGDENEELAKASKVVALASVAIDTGVAIAKGVAAAQSVPFPANLAAVATTIATVMGNIATAVSTIKSAKFAEGGLVQGAGSETSDSIPAHLSNGEFVVKASAVRKPGNLERLVAMNGGWGNTSKIPKFATGGLVSTDALNQTANAGNLREMIRAAVEDIHPVVSVREINSVQANVQVKENISKR